MYHVSAQGIDERMINVHYYYYYIYMTITVEDARGNTGHGPRKAALPTDSIELSGVSNSVEAAQGLLPSPAVLASSTVSSRSCLAASSVIQVDYWWVMFLWQRNTRLFVESLTRLWHKSAGNPRQHVPVRQIVWQVSLSHGCAGIGC